MKTNYKVSNLKKAKSALTKFNRIGHFSSIGVKNDRDTFAYERITKKIDSNEDKFFEPIDKFMK